MATAQDIINGAFRLIHISAPSDTDSSDALEVLNDYLSMLSIEQITVPYVTSESFSLVASTNTYTIGSGGAFDTVRPMKIESAFIRDSAGNDYTLDVVIAKGDYNRNSLKTYAERPEELTYVPSYPLGKIYLYGTPVDAETIHIDSYKPLTEFSALTTTYALPLEYKQFLKYNLAILLHPIYKGGEALSAVIAKIADESRNSIENYNAGIPPVLRIDNALL